MSFVLIVLTTHTQDGTLTDSISAVEAAWGKVAKDIGQDPAYVIAATHGKRAVDNLAQFKPHIKEHEMDSEVQAFEESILYFADAYNKHGPGSQTGSPWPSATPATPATPYDSGFATPDMGSAPSSRHGSFSGAGRRPSFGTRLGNMLAMSSVEPRRYDNAIAEDADEEEGGDENQLQEVDETELGDDPFARGGEGVSLDPGNEPWLKSDCDYTYEEVCLHLAVS